MDSSKLKLEIKRLTEKLGSVDHFSKQFNSYEKRVREVAKDFDLRSRDARDKSKEQIEKFTSQLKKTRGEVEAQLKTLVNQEGKKLNESLGELFGFLKSLSTHEKRQAKAKTTPAATAEKTTPAKAPVKTASKSAAKSAPKDALKATERKSSTKVKKKPPSRKPSVSVEPTAAH